MPRYDRPDGSYTQSIPSGTTALRRAVAEHFGVSRAEVVRDRSRCQQSSSEHCECRAVDFFVRVPLGRRIFETLVAAADELYIQSVIHNYRQWGFGLWYERPTSSSQHPHDDHVHVGINKTGAQLLTVDRALAALRRHDPESEDQAEMWMTEERFREILREELMGLLADVEFGQMRRESRETHQAMGRTERFIEDDLRPWMDTWEAAEDDER